GFLEMSRVLPSGSRALLEPEESLAEPRTLHRARELLLREIPETRLEAPQAVAPPRRLAGPRALILAVLGGSPPPARPPLAHRPALTQLGPDLRAEVCQPLVDALEPLADLIGVDRVLRGLTRQLGDPALDVLEPRSELLGPRQRPGRPLPGTRGDGLDR